MRRSEPLRGSGGLGAVPSNKQGASVATDALLAKEQTTEFDHYGLIICCSPLNEKLIAK